MLRERSVVKKAPGYFARESLKEHVHEGMEKECPIKVMARDDTDCAHPGISWGEQLRRPLPGLIHHSDRVSQYFARVTGNIFQENGLVDSMSRKGIDYDNAPNESS